MAVWLPPSSGGAGGEQAALLSLAAAAELLRPVLSAAQGFEVGRRAVVLRSLLELAMMMMPGSLGSNNVSHTTFHLLLLI